jgi:hypothetical protein
MQADFYGYSQLPYYTPDMPYDVLYINSCYFGNEENMYKQIAGYGVDTENTVKIRVNDTRTILKRYR